MAATGATVLVLEAGGSAPPETVVPGLMPSLIGGDLDWNIRLKSQTKSQLGFYDNVSVCEVSVKCL